MHTFDLMKKQITSFFFGVLTVTILLNCYFVSIFKNSDLINTKTIKSEKTIQLKKDSYSFAINELEEEEDDEFSNSQKNKSIFLFLNNKPFYSDFNFGINNSEINKIINIEFAFIKKPLPLWLETRQIII